VIEGAEIQTGKEHSLAVLITRGTVAWLRQSQDIDAKKNEQDKKTQFAPKPVTEILTMLLANLYETRVVG